MRKIRVVHIITRLDRGGSSENTLLSLLGLDRNKYECALLYGLTKDPDKKYFASAKSATEVFLCIEDLVREISPFKDLKAFFKIFTFLRRGHFDIVHTHSSKGGILGRWAAWFAGAPVIVHTPHGHVFYGYYGKLLSNAFVFAEKVSSLITDRIVSLTQRGKNEHISFGVGSEKKISVIHSGVDVDFIRNFDSDEKGLHRKKLGIPHSALVVGSMGRFTKIKGYEYFVEAADILSAQKKDNIYFLLAGEGELGEKLKSEVREKKLEDRFFFLPWQEDARVFLRSLDIFVLTSLNEGMGKVVIEAMSAGLPVIGTDVGGVREIVEDEVTGYVVPAGDGRAVARKIDELCDKRDLLKEMGKRGYRRAEKFSIASMVSKIDNLYEVLLREKDIR